MTEGTSQGCPKCGGKMDEGRVPKGLSALSGYESNSQKYFSFALHFQKARACLDCGYVELYLDPSKLRSKLGAQEK